MLENLIAMMTGWDVQAYLWVNRLPHPDWLLWPAWAVEMMTYRGLLWIGVCLWLIRWGTTRLRRLAKYGLALMALATTAHLMIKDIVGRPRPFVELEAAIAYTPDWIVTTATAFPSGHTTTAFALATFVSMVTDKKLVAMMVYVMAGLIAIERVYIGVHYPLDVLGGMILGTIIGRLGFKVLMMRSGPDKSGGDKVRVGGE